MMSFCPSCHVGRLQKRSMVYLEWHGQDLLVVDHMPAIICDLCGARSYDNNAMEYLQRLLLSSPPDPPRVISNRNKFEVKHKGV